MDEKKQPQATPPEINRMRGGAISLALVLTAIHGYGLYVAAITPSLTWPAGYVIAAIMVVNLVLNAVGVLLSLRGRLIAALGFVYYPVYALVIGLVLFYQNRAVTITLAMLIVASLLIGFVYPREKRRWPLLTTLLTIAVIWAIELFSPAWRLPLPVAPQVGLIAGGIFVLLLMLIIVRDTLEFSTSVRNKILVPVLVILTLTLSGEIIIGAVVASQGIVRTENQRLENLDRVFLSRIASLEDFAAALAINTAQNPEVQAAFASQNRERLTELTLPAYLEIDRLYGVPQHQFHLPPAISFLRLHQLERFGDDLSSFRATVLAANAEQKIVAGVEIGRGGLGVRGVAPVSYQGQYIGTVEFGLNIGQQLLTELKNQFETDWQILLLREPAQIATFASPRAEIAPPHPELVFQASTLETAFFASEKAYSTALEGTTLIETATFDGVTYSVLNAPLYDFSGEVIGVVNIISDQTLIAQRQNRQIVSSFFALSVTLLLASALVYLLVNNTISPINPLTESARAVAAGNLEQVVAVKSRDELGVLAQTFNQMIAELRGLIASLEQQVTERTRALETSTEVSRRLSTILDRDQLVREVVEQLRVAFGYYHAQIYLFDARKQNLVMAGGTGDAGLAMMARSHKIESGRGLVGQAAQNNQIVLIPDVSQAQGWLPNVLLPDTRSEVAVPIAVGSEVIGVLDVQHNVTNGLSQQDADLIQAIANQVGIALQNAQAYEQSASQVQVETAVNEISQKIQRAVTVEETLQIAVRELGQTLGAERVTGLISAKPIEEDR